MDWVECRATQFDMIQEDHYSRAQRGTGKWFTESKEFQELVSGVMATLYCPGIPGVGKTILSSVITNELQNDFPDEDTNIAVVYFNYKGHAEQGLMRILCSIAWQFIRKRRSLDSALKSFHEQLKRKEPTSDAVVTLLGDLARDSARSFIVLDALDELSNDGSNNSRKALLNCLAQAQVAAGGEKKLRLHMTARPDTDLTVAVVPEAVVKIYSADWDLRLYLNIQLGDLDSLPDDADEEEEAVEAHVPLKSRIVDKIIEVSGGM